MTEQERLTPERLAELRRIAEAATPGPWEWRMSKDGRILDLITLESGYNEEVITPSHLNAWLQVKGGLQDFIPAFDPATVLALLDRIEALEQERDAARGKAEKLRSVIHDLLPIAEARVAWEEEYESDALSSTSWIESKTRVIARAKEVLGDDTGGASMPDLPERCPFCNSGDRREETWRGRPAYSFSCGTVFYANGEVALRYFSCVHDLAEALKRYYKRMMAARGEGTD